MYVKWTQFDFNYWQGVNPSNWTSSTFFFQPRDASDLVSLWIWTAHRFVFWQDLEWPWQPVQTLLRWRGQTCFFFFSSPSLDISNYATLWHTEQGTEETRFHEKTILQNYICILMHQSQFIWIRFHLLFHQTFFSRKYLSACSPCKIPNSLPESSHVCWLGLAPALQVAMPNKK